MRTPLIATFITSLSLSAFTLGLTGCTTPQKAAKAPSDIVLSETPLKPAEAMSREELRAQRLNAQTQQAWSDYLQLTEVLWHQANDREQAEIERQTWQTLAAEFKDIRRLQRLRQAGDLPAQQWADLLEAMQQPGLYAYSALQTLKEWRPNAIYQHHLLAELSETFKQPSVKQLAVLLPLSGKYQEVGEQIRNGLLKAYMISNRQTGVRFYDTSDPQQVVERYQQAVHEGADFVVGPLTKESVERLAQYLKQQDGLENTQTTQDGSTDLKPFDTANSSTDLPVITSSPSDQGSHTAPVKVLALNETEQAGLNSPLFLSFNYRSQTESQQITQQLEANRYQRIGILSSEMSRDMNNAQSLLSQWLSNPQNQAVFKSYPVEKLNLRKALGDLINEEASQARYNNLRWLLGEKLEFFPRTRQDLQAIVLIGNAKQVAVFHPQFEFFQLQLPVYATSNLTPANLQKIENNPDLANVIFPTIPAIFTPHALQSPLEAFGWDSFILAMQHHKLADNLCLNQGQSGILYRNPDYTIDKKLVWAHYSPIGQLTRWVPPPEPQEADAEAVSDEKAAPPTIERQPVKP
ncbi:penicillin-binding protein activator [Thiomicrorhabdus sp. zzn3]|uniref:penicillin-binding protein activator n=1 Tax=Thiomicrorhabdus sp. zzn3 TaxID=3039775 RepID=UPI00243707B6|nr:penicillin-binding protein activator [Thiomicrorhabdus sp. zzn3]MDG6778521.1 penicillin-binding protein activator [Thiomicrorhabdus sp. zzn3]